MFCGIKREVTTRVKMLSFGIDTVQAHNRFATRLLPADNTLFKVSPEIHCSGVCSSYCCYGMQSNIRL